jgi:hypothetical protein
MHMVWCNAECDDAMPSNFSGLSTNAWYQQQHCDDLIKKVNHSSFEREALKVPREKEICHKGQILLKILIGDLIKKTDLTVGNKIMNRCIGFKSTVAISYTQIQ